MDQLQSMQVFVKVVDTGSFISASDVMGISRPMASKHVARLELSLGVSLLHRTTRTLSMTEAGRTYYMRCQDILSRIDEAAQEAGNLRVHPKGQLRISAPHSFGRKHLARSIAKFQQNFPDIEVDLTLNDRLIDLIDEGFDLAIRIGHLSDSSLIARKLAPCQLKVCAAPSYIDKHGIPETPADLARHNCLAYSYLAEGPQWQFTKDEQAHTVKISGTFKANSGDAIIEAAAEGLGIIIEPTFITGPYLETGALIPLLTDYAIKPRGVYAVYPDNRLLPQKIRVFIDFLVKQYGTTPYWDKWST